MTTPLTLVCSHSGLTSLFETASNTLGQLGDLSIVVLYCFFLIKFELANLKYSETSEVNGTLCQNLLLGRNEVLEKMTFNSTPDTDNTNHHHRFTMANREVLPHPSCNSLVQYTLFG